MATEIRPDGTVRIDEMSLADYVRQIVYYANLGYTLGDRNEDYPQGFSSWFTAGMFPPAAVTVQEVQQEVSNDSSEIRETAVQEEQAAKPATRARRTTAK